MADPEQIIAQIGIAGQDDIIAALGEVGKAGEEAFARLADSAGQVGAAFAAVATAVAGLAAGIGLLAEGGAKATQAVGDLAAATGESAENISAMQGALASVGGSSDNLGFAFRRLAFEVTTQWDQIQKAVQDRSQQVIQAQLKVKETAQAVITAQETALRAQQSIGGGPLPGVPQTQRTPFQQQQDQRVEAELKYQQAVEASREAQKAASDQQRNDINNVVEAIGRVVKGEQSIGDAAKQINPTLDNVFKGIIGNSGDAAEAILNYDGDQLKLAESSPKVLAVLEKTADFFKHSGDDALNAAIGLRELGRGSGTLVAAMQQLGSTGLDELIKKFKDLGTATKSSDVSIARDFNSTLGTLRFELTSIRDSISTAFQPGIAGGLKSFQKFIEDNRESLVKLGSTIAETVTPAIKAFFSALEGVVASITGAKLEPGDGIAAKWKATLDPIIAELKDLLKQLHEVETSANAVGEALSQAASGHPIDALKTLAAELKRGASEPEAGIGLTPSPSAPSPAATGVVAPQPSPTVVAPTAPAFTPPKGFVVPPTSAGAGLPPGFVAAPSAAAPLPSNFVTAPTSVPQVPQAPQQPIPVVVTGINGSAASVPQIVGGSGTVPVSGSPTDQLGNQVVGDLIDALSQASAAVTSFIQSLAAASQIQANAGASASEGHAEGGMIHGPGGPTSDSVPAMLSAGEGVITASSVDHYGGASFIDSINSKTLSLPKFAIGGLVEAFSAPLANYATSGPISANGPFGGPNSARTPIVLNIGGEQVHGLEATDKAAEQISKIAVGRAVRSGYSQSKSSWYRGS